MSSASMEAAMAGADYTECGVDLVGDRVDAEAPPPPHLLLVHEQPEPVPTEGLLPFDGGWPCAEEEMKERGDMSVASTEALAMAGADYVKCGVDIGASEDDAHAPPPLHLLLPDDGLEEMFGEYCSTLLRDDGRLREQKMKEKLVAWSKAVANLVVREELHCR
ncbi:hypothetical protein Taro_040283 [Colocasia esculenta]|uniref:Uncharacterized protein n=1 Tax=Colocasia esculenta TaxID=4460 RepID=A0A843W8K2_COLES|nr:hypothetical protein [Colocasia esculenta]